jgi:O-methyltransferase
VSALIESLLARHSLISDQVSKEQVKVILTELEKTLTQGTAGAVVEFGCYIGTTSLFIRRLLDALGEDREFHAYDSFAGLPPKTTEDESRAGEQFQAGELAVSKKTFLQQFKKAGLQPPITHKDWFSDLAEQDVPSDIAFAFLDGDFYSSIRDSLRLVRPRLQQGGCLIIDDYAREALPGAAKAVHELLAGRTIITSHNLGIIRV